MKTARVVDGDHRHRINDFDIYASGEEDVYGFPKDQTGRESTQTRAKSSGELRDKGDKQYRQEQRHNRQRDGISLEPDTLAEQHQRLGKRHREGGKIVPAFFHGYDQKH